MNSILKTYIRKFLKTINEFCFHPQKAEMLSKCVFQTKNVIFNTTKDAPVRFFIYMYSMCVQLFTAFEEAVHFHGNQPREKMRFVFSPYFSY